MTVNFTSKKAEWEPVAVLPGLQVSGSIGNRFAKMVGSDHAVLLKLRERHPKLNDFCLRFSNSFGAPVTPSFIIMHSSFRHRTTDGTALLAFRNAISLSITLRSAADNLTFARATGDYRFSDNADFYPWMLGRDNHSLYSSNASKRAISEIATFQGQPPPQVSIASINAETGDLHLRSTLLDRWTKTFVQCRPKRSDRQLFRALELAYEASRLPAGYFTSEIDVGRLVALWVSAFETSVHPGGNQRVDAQHVTSELSKYQPCQQRLKARVFQRRTYERGKTHKVNVALPDKAYNLLYDARNTYLHGNKITQKTLQPKGYNASVYQVAPPLFRLLLETLLVTARPLPQCPSPDNLTAWGPYFAAVSERNALFRNFENAILSFHKPLKD